MTEGAGGTELQAGRISHAGSGLGLPSPLAWSPQAIIVHGPSRAASADPNPLPLQLSRKHTATCSDHRGARSYASARGRHLGSREKCGGAKCVASVRGSDAARGRRRDLGETGRAPTPTCSNMKQQKPTLPLPNPAQLEPMWPLPSLAAPPPAPNRGRPPLLANRKSHKLRADGKHSRDNAIGQ